jgi:hypothetical protein
MVWLQPTNLFQDFFHVAIVSRMFEKRQSEHWRFNRSLGADERHSALLCGTQVEERLTQRTPPVVPKMRDDLQDDANYKQKPADARHQSVFLHCTVHVVVYSANPLYVTAGERTQNCFVRSEPDIGYPRDDLLAGRYQYRSDAAKYQSPYVHRSMLQFAFKRDPPKVWR